MKTPTARLPQQFLDYYAGRVERGQAMALVTVLSTEGSTYSKAGHQLLLDDTGDFQGILSGGCLEGDIAERAGKAIRECTPVIVVYDLSDNDNLFGLGVGCEGAMQVLIQPLTSESGYEPMSTIVRDIDNDGLVDIDVIHGDGIAKSRWLRPGRVLLLGAGPDVDPLLEMCSALGWAVTVNDHRPAYVSRLQGSDAAEVVQSVAGDIGSSLDLSRFDAAVVMSHNITTDREYLRQLGKSDINFVGLLGPPQRRDRLLAELGNDAELLSNRLRAPVGRQIGGRGPAAIALEVVVELQEFLCRLDQQLSSASRSASVSISIEAGSKLTATTS